MLNYRIFRFLFEVVVERAVINFLGKEKSVVIISVLVVYIMFNHYC